MRIAVCLSGQPRTVEYTVENIKNYFSDYEVDYFCHAWNYNTYKRKKENTNPNEQPIYWEDDTLEDVNQIHNHLLKFNPKQIAIEGNNKLPIKWWYSSMFYSMMMANHYKKLYELQHNFRYDLVFRARYDSVFNPMYKFKPHPDFDKDNYLDVYGLFKERMFEEFNRLNLSDYMFYGSSTAMDFICDAYRHLYRTFAREDNWDPLGPGTLMSDICDKYNFNFRALDKFWIDNSIYRKEMIPIDAMQNYEDIRKFNNSFYIKS